MDFINLSLANSNTFQKNLKNLLVLCKVVTYYLINKLN